VRPSSLAVIGLGAIGGSLAWQARRAGVSRVVGYSPSRAEGVQALAASAISELADSPATAARGSDLVVLAVPPRATLDLIGRLAPALEPGAVLTDVCSVKEPVVARAREAGLGNRFAGGHPLAGTHASGFAAARPDRLRGGGVRAGRRRGGRGRAGGDGFWGRCSKPRPSSSMPRRTTGSSPGPTTCPKRWPTPWPGAGDRELGGVSQAPAAIPPGSRRAAGDVGGYSALTPALDEALERTARSLGELPADRGGRRQGLTAIWVARPSARIER
jgi:hypothetical protein